MPRAFPPASSRVSARAIAAPRPRFSASVLFAQTALAALAATALLHAGDSHAQSSATLATVGDAQTQNTLQMPLSVSAPLTLAPGVSARGLKATVLQAGQCAPLGLTCSNFSSNVKARVVSAGDGQASLQLSSSAATRDPEMVVAVALTGPQGTQLAPISILLDAAPAPSARVDASQQAALDAATAASVKQTTSNGPQPVAQKFDWTQVANPAQAGMSNPPQQDKHPLNAPVLAAPSADALAANPPAASGISALPIPGPGALAASLPPSPAPYVPGVPAPSDGAPLAMPANPNAALPTRADMLPLPPALAPNAGGPNATAGAAVGTTAAPAPMVPLQAVDNSGFLGLSLLSWIGIVICALLAAVLLLRKRIQDYLDSRDDLGSFTEGLDLEPADEGAPSEHESTFNPSVSVGRPAATRSGVAAATTGAYVAAHEMSGDDYAALASNRDRNEISTGLLHQELADFDPTARPVAPAIEMDDTGDDTHVTESITDSMGVSPDLLNLAEARMRGEAIPAPAADDGLATLRAALEDAPTELNGDIEHGEPEVASEQGAPPDHSAAIAEDFESSFGSFGAHLLDEKKPTPATERTDAERAAPVALPDFAAELESLVANRDAADRGASVSAPRSVSVGGLDFAPDDTPVDAARNARRGGADAANALERSGAGEQAEPISYTPIQPLSVGRDKDFVPVDMPDLDMSDLNLDVPPEAPVAPAPVAPIGLEPAPPAAPAAAQTELQLDPKDTVPPAPIYAPPIHVGTLSMRTARRETEEPIEAEWVLGAPDGEMAPAPEEPTEDIDWDKLLSEDPLKKK